jgi:hypothetical protein
VAVSLFGRGMKARPGSPDAISVGSLYPTALVARLPALVAPEDDESRMMSKTSGSAEACVSPIDEARSAVPCCTVKLRDHGGTRELGRKIETSDM